MKGTTIIGGKIKRHKMGSVPQGLQTRPILARIKKSLFDILKSRIEGSRFLDLFAGSGSVGLEAFSRGAARVVFVDSNAVCARWIEKTLSGIQAANPELLRAGETQVYRHDVTSALGWLHEEFALISPGAPYQDERNRPLAFVQFLLETIEKDKLLSSEGWFISQHSIQETFNAPAGWNFFRQ